MASEALEAAADDAIPGTDVTATIVSAKDVIPVKNDAVSTEDVILGINDTMSAENVIPGTDDTVSAEDVITGTSDFGTAEDVITGTSDMGTAEDVIAVTSDLGTAEDVIPATNDKWTAEDVIPGSNEDVIPGSNKDVITGSNKDVITGSNEDVIPGSNKDVITGSNEDVIPATKDTGTAEDVIPATKDTGTAEDVIPATKDTGTAEDVIPATKDTGKAEDVIPATKDTGTAEDVIPATKDTGTAEDVIPATKDTGTAEDVIPATKDTGTAEDVIPATKDTGTAEDFIPATKDTGTAEDVITATKDTGTAEDVITGSTENVIPANKDAGRAEDVIPGTHDTGTAEDVIQGTTDDTALTVGDHDQLQGCLQSLDLSRLCQPTPEDWEPTYLQGQSEVTIDSDTGGYVHTDDLSEATDVVEETGRVVLCGPPGSGKTTLAHALLRRCREDGFKPYIFSDVKDWQAHIAEGKPSVVLMDGTLGEVRVDGQQYRQWRSMLTSLLQLTGQGQCRVVLTLYPHVLRELRELEGETFSPLLDDLAVVQLMKNSLSKDVKERLLHFHLQRLHLQPSPQRSLVEKVLRRDTSGPVFHWCCRHMVDNWYASEDPSAIFANPAEAYVPLLKRMLRDAHHGDTFAAVLALIMKGLGGFLHDPRRVRSHLKELRFQDFSEYHLAEYADVLKGSILGAEDYGFASRVLYDATGLALGRAFSVPIVLKVCDVRFFVRYVRTQLPTVDFSVSVGANDNVRQIFMQKMYDYVVNGQVAELCQHPSLSCSDFLEEFEAFCDKEKNKLTRFASASDTTHGLPLLYWSAWSPSASLTQWCLKIISRPSLFRRGPPQSVLSSALLSVILAEPSSRLNTTKAEPYASLLLNLLKPGQMEPKNTDFVTHVFPIPSQLLTEEANLKHDRLLKRCRSGVLKFTLTDVSAAVTEGVARITMPQKVWFSLVAQATSKLKAQATTENRHHFLDVIQDPENTELHVAAAQEDLEAIRRAVKDGASLTERNSLGMTPSEVAECRRLFRGEYSYDKEYSFFGTAAALGDISLLRSHSGLVSDYLRKRLDKNPNKTEVRQLHEAIKDGDMESVKVLLCYKAGVHELVSDVSPLHVACAKGSKDVVTLLILLGANVNVTRVSGDTPLIEACLRGHVDIARQLVENGADANITGFGGYSALDLARGNSELLKVLLETDPDINHRTGFERMTALHRASNRGDTLLVSRLLAHGADPRLETKEGLTSGDLALKQGHHEVVELLRQATERWCNRP